MLISGFILLHAKNVAKELELADVRWRELVTVRS